MFSDPLTINTEYSTLTVNAAKDKSFTCTGRGETQSTYRYIDADGNTWDLLISHSATRRNRVVARLSVSGLTPNLLLDGSRSAYSQAVYVVGDFPLSGSVNSAAYTDPTLFETMIKGVGSLLVSQGAADPLFLRAVKGET